MSKVKTSIVVDQGPPERSNHFKVAVERGANFRARLRILDQIEIDRLLLEKKISLDQHTSGEHLFRDVNACGYFPACKWALDSNIRGASQTISQHRANALVKIGLATAWLNGKAGRRTTRLLFSVILGERKVQDNQLHSFRLGLDKYQGFESWWQGKDAETPLPELLAELPGNIRKMHVQPDDQGQR